MAPRSKPTPVDAPRDFRIEEMFFSTTDQRGIITSGNEVFVRIAGYAIDELLGQAHNIVRHPDMPRAFYRLVWDRLKQGLPVAGYVKNLAADGRYYWVYAVLTPLQDGYLSVRFKPTTETLARIASLYGTMRQAEQAAGKNSAASMDAGLDRLHAGLQALGFHDYESFMVAALHAELKSRDETIRRQGLELVSSRLKVAEDANGDSMQSIYRKCQATYAEINHLYGELDQYARLRVDLLKHFNSVVDAASEFQVIALNATIKSAHMGAQGRCIGVVAGQLADISRQISVISADLTQKMGPVTAGLQTIILNLATARLQLEMIMRFCEELAAPTNGITQADDVENLVTSLEHTMRLVVDGLNSAQAGLQGFSLKAEEMHRHNLTMQVVQIGGAVEACRLEDGGSLSQTFLDVRHKTEGSKAKLEELSDVIERFGQLAKTAPQFVRHVITTVEATKSDIGAFLALLRDHHTRNPDSRQLQPVLA